jgi:hypothetical protein
MGDTMVLYAHERRKQPLPAAMKAAYKKYGIATTEMAAEGFAMPCAQYGKLELPGEKYKTCTCRAEGIKGMTARKLIGNRATRRAAPRYRAAARSGRGRWRRRQHWLTSSTAPLNIIDRPVSLSPSPSPVAKYR